MKKIVPALAVVGSSAVVMAEDAAITTPDGILTAGKTALDSLMTTALPIIGAILVAGLTLWGAFKLVRVLMKAFGYGASR